MHLFKLFMIGIPPHSNLTRTELKDQRNPFVCKSLPPFSHTPQYPLFYSKVFSISKFSLLGEYLGDNWSYRSLDILYLSICLYSNISYLSGRDPNFVLVVKQIYFLSGYFTVSFKFYYSYVGIINLLKFLFRSNQFIICFV